MKVALLSPKGPLYRHRHGIFRKSLRYQPLTLTTLAALVPPELDVQIQAVRRGQSRTCREIPDADIVGMTVITGTAKRAYELAGRYRAHGITVVLGGPHVTLVPDEAKCACRRHRRRLCRRHVAATAARLRYRLAARRYRPGA